MTNKVHNFSAGPGILPEEVLRKSAEACINFKNSNLSLLEISHRSKDWVEVMDDIQVMVKRLLNLPKGYSVLFLQGGASTQFAMVPFNLLSLDGQAAYLNTGVWAKKAYQEAKKMGNTVLVASSEDKNYSYIPKGYSIPENSDYLHITSNNTIYGTQIKDFPYDCPVPLVCDMSSDMFSRPIEADKFSLIYAGAQKNMGPAGATLVIVKDDVLGKTTRNIPTMLDYKIHIDSESMYNTPPVFSIYVSYLTLQWLENQGGVSAIHQKNRTKADLLYNEIDKNGLFEGTANAYDRSDMNVCFIPKDEKNTDIFLNILKEANISGLKGHRSVGGFRASIYNAMPIESVQVLVDVMKEFERKNG